MSSSIESCQAAWTSFPFLQHYRNLVGGLDLSQHQHHQQRANQATCLYDPDRHRRGAVAVPEILVAASVGGRLWCLKFVARLRGASCIGRGTRCTLFAKARWNVSEALFSSVFCSLCLTIDDARAHIGTHSHLLSGSTSRSSSMLSISRCSTSGLVSGGDDQSCDEGQGPEHDWESALGGRKQAKVRGFICPCSHFNSPRSTSQA